jgi:hypothetical protein
MRALQMRYRHAPTVQVTHTPSLQAQHTPTLAPVAELGMMGLHVSSQVDFSLERPGAGSTGKWLESGVLPRVCDEVRGLTESFSALTAYVRLLTCKRKPLGLRKCHFNSFHTFISDTHRPMFKIQVSIY